MGTTNRVAHFSSKLWPQVCVGLCGVYFLANEINSDNFYRRQNKPFLTLRPFLQFTPRFS